MMYRVFSGANGEYVAFVDTDGYHHQPADCGSQNGWSETARLQQEADRLNESDSEEE